MEKRKFFTIFMVVCFSSLIFAGGVKDKVETIETRTVVDHNGDTVTIPANPKRVVITSLLPLPSVYSLFKGNVDDLVGMHPSSYAAAKNSYLLNVYPKLADVSTSFVVNGVINIEQLINLKPDVVFYSAANVAEKEILKNSGISSVGFSTKLSGYNCVETYANWITLLGEIYGDQEKATKIIDKGRAVEKMISDKASSIAENDKPKVLVLFNYADGVIKTSGSDFFGEYWIETPGGKNVAENLSSTPVINMEQIYEWNPEIIFITNFSPYQPEDLYDNSIDGHDWSTVEAVKNRKVYKFPLGMYRWFPPSSDTPLSLMWLATKIQPEVFSDIDMDKEILLYYKEFYGKDLTADDLYAIYHPASEASGLTK